ncbi:hypothetical protein [Streptomyces sp. AcE210]|nr:hypothetical protein [Streptomyces sp. AcE210]
MSRLEGALEQALRTAGSAPEALALVAQAYAAVAHTTPVLHGRVQP